MGFLKKVPKVIITSVIFEWIQVFSCGYFYINPMIHLYFILKQSKGKLVTAHLDNRWRWVISFTPRPLHLREREAGTHRTGRWCAAQSDTRVRVWRRETSLPGIELEFLDHPDSILFTIPSRLLMFLLVNISRMDTGLCFVLVFPSQKTTEWRESVQHFAGHVCHRKCVGIPSQTDRRL